MKDKILTISVAAYNVEKYLTKTLESLIVDCQELLEVLIVDDGSSDATPNIAEEFTKKYPQIFRLIRKKNGGYGSTINVGIAEARGKYFKQLDGDDWYDTKNLEKLCAYLEVETADVIYTPYIQYNLIDGATTLCDDLSDCCKEGKKVDLGVALSNVNSGHLAMHSLAYKTEVLRKNKIKITEKCFYTDTEYVLFPIMASRTLAYYPLPIYYYGIGQEGQSMSSKGVRKHYLDHWKVASRIFESVTGWSFNDSKVKKFCYSYCARILISDFCTYRMIPMPSIKNYWVFKRHDRDIANINMEIFEAMNKKLTIRIVRKTGYLGYFLVNVAKKVKHDMLGRGYF